MNSNEKMKTYVTDIENGKRLDNTVSNLFDISRNYAQKLILEEHVKVNEIIIKSKNHKVFTGDNLEVFIPIPHDYIPVPQNIKLDIMFEDDDILIVNKPKGMVVHPGAGNFENTLTNALLNYCGNNLSDLGGKERPGIVHRLDKDTSGLVVVAKNNYSHENLSKQFAERKVLRLYHGVVHGRIKKEQGIIDNYIARNKTDRQKMAIVNSGAAGAKHAISEYNVISVADRYTYLSICLTTGRTHQIRVQMANMGHPVAGDRQYGPKKPAKGLESQCLHAKVIGIMHPRNGSYMEFTSELPEYFNSFLKGLSLEHESEN